MIIDDTLITKATAYADAVEALDSPSVDLASAVASYRHRLANGSDRSAYAHGRAVIKLAERAGLKPAGKAPTKADLEAEVVRRNEGRADDQMIVVPAKATKADLEQLLADDEA